jgi:hypothetical protein
MAGRELGLLQFLVELARTSEDEVKMRTLRIISGLSVAEENKTLMTEDELGLVSVIVDILRVGDTDEIRDGALSILQNISSAEENQALLASSDLGLIPLLVTAVSEEEGDARIDSLSVLKNLSLDDESRVLLVSEDEDLLSVVIDVVAGGDDVEARLAALELLSSLALAEENKTLMVSEDVGLLAAFVSAMEDIAANDCDDADALELVTSTLLQLSSPATVSADDGKDVFKLQADGLEEVLLELQGAKNVTEEAKKNITELLSRLGTSSRATVTSSSVQPQDKGKSKGKGVKRGAIAIDAGDNAVVAKKAK